MARLYLEGAAKNYDDALESIYRQADEFFGDHRQPTYKLEGFSATSEKTISGQVTHYWYSVYVSNSNNSTVNNREGGTTR